MKKLIYLLAAVAFVSCSKEEALTPPSQSGKVQTESRIAPVEVFVQQRELDLGYAYTGYQDNVQFYVNSYVAYSKADRTPIGFYYVGGIYGRIYRSGGGYTEKLSESAVDYTWSMNDAENVVSYSWSWDFSKHNYMYSGTGSRRLDISVSDYPFDPSLPWGEGMFPMQ